MSKFHQTRLLTRIITRNNKESAEDKQRKYLEELGISMDDENSNSKSIELEEVWTEFSLDLSAVSGFYKTIKVNEDDSEQECTHVYWDGIDVVIEDTYKMFFDVIEKYNKT